MLLSELIATLEAQVKEHGDCRVQVAEVRFYERSTAYQYSLKLDYLAEREAEREALRSVRADVAGIETEIRGIE